MEITRQRLILVMSAGVAVVGLALFLFLYHPLMDKIKARYAECHTIEGEAAQARENTAKAREIARDKILISEEEVSPVIEELTKQGNLQGINFISLAPKDAEKYKDSPYRILPIEIETESSYEALGKFLGFVDGLKSGLVTVGTFEVTSGEKDAAKLKAKLTVHLYLLG